MFILSIIAQVRAFMRYRETVYQLSKLSDRELTDLGILRDDIERVARTHAAA